MVRGKEKYCWILDYLPRGHSTDKTPIYQRKPIVQAVGEDEFTLMEMYTKPNVTPEPHQRVYVGKGKRDMISRVIRRLKYDDLTHDAKLELPHVLRKVVLVNEDRFIDVYDKSGLITPRLHTLALLPGIGKKTMWDILNERKVNNFKSFLDLASRVKSLQHPENNIAKRIEMELGGEDDGYRLFIPG